MATLYIIPSFLAPDTQSHIPSIVTDTINQLNVFVVERTRTARRFIRSMSKDFVIDNAIFIELDKHDMASSKKEIAAALAQHVNIGLLSEAGTPCIADPGALVVNMARTQGYHIKPLSGPSSLFLALMASGMNGQEFTFHGYLPIKDGDLIKKLKEISSIAIQQNNTHIFIETPYRNIKLVQQIKKQVDSNLHICISKNLSDTSEEISTIKIKDISIDAIDKSPTIYCIGKLQL